MPIQINQKFPRCQLCGKIIPLRAAPVEISMERQMPLRFCSAWCRDEYARRHPELEMYRGAGGPAWP